MMHAEVLAALSGKLAFVTFLWVAFFVIEKVSLDAFVTRVYLNDQKPPNLLAHVSFAFAALLPCIAIIGAVTYLLIERGGKDRAIFLMQGPIVKLVMLDLLACWLLAFLASLIVARVTQGRKCLRFQDDGLRGIRACYSLALSLSATLCVPPYFLAF